MAANRYILTLDLRDGGACGAVPKAPSSSPGDSAKSILYQRVSHADKSRRMPPPDAELSLNDKKQVQFIRQWIDEGTKWETHWAFIQQTVPLFLCGPWRPLREMLSSTVPDRHKLKGLPPSCRVAKQTTSRPIHAVPHHLCYS